MFDHNTSQFILNTLLHPLVHDDKNVGRLRKMVFILFAVHIEFVLQKLQITLIYVFRVSGARFESLRSPPKI